MKTRVFCVLRSGGDFTASDVATLRVMFEKHLPDYELNCLSDIDVPCTRIPLEYGWPGWWSKMELFRPDLKGDIFYVDLDTIIVGDVRELIEVQSLDTMLDDFYYPVKPASGLMYITEKSRSAVWDQWFTNPSRIMSQCGTGGDQKFLGEISFGKNARRWQKEFPGQVISFKAHMRPRGGKPQLVAPPRDTRIVCFHGKPRPRNINEPWINEARRVG